MMARTEMPGRADGAGARRSGWVVPITGLLWAASFMAARGALEAVEFGSASAVVIALLPVPFFAVFLGCLIAAVRRSDELEKQIQLEALAFAYPLTMLGLMLLGLLELAVDLNADNWSYRHVWALLPLFYFAGLAMARRRYQ